MKAKRSRVTQGAGRRRAPAPKTAVEMHRAWLELVDTEGPFLAVPPVKRVWPHGIPPLNDNAKATLVAAKPAFDRAWDEADRNPDDEAYADAYRTARDTWVELILRDVFGWGELLVATTERSTERRTPTSEQARPAAWALTTPEGETACLVWVVDRIASLRDAPGDGRAEGWVDRFEIALRTAGVSVGVLTDGRWWALVSAPEDSLAASGIVDAQTWIEESAARDAFAALLSRIQLISGPEDERLPALFQASVLAADEITEALGVQVRRAVELVVAAFSEASSTARERGLPDPLPEDANLVYEAVVTVLMRVVFLLFAEERDLLPSGELFARGYGLAGALDELDDRARSEGEEAMDSTFGIWHRLLATSRALWVGASFEDLRLPAYGGSLFDPQRFDFLAARTERGTLALRVSDRVMLQVLRAVQVARPRSSDARRISFRDIDVEQIGYIYEGLLGYTCQRVDEVVVGLLGKDGQEPEIPLAVLRELAEEHSDDAALAAAILAWIKQDQPAAQPPTKSGLTKALAAGDAVTDAERALLAITPDADLRGELATWLGAIRRDLRDRPVVTLPGGLIVVETPSRRNAGAHYTPRELAEEVVRHALDPLCYSLGPYDTADENAWLLKPSSNLLDLKVADIACGSGAFLVAAARHLAKRVVEAWHVEGLAHGPAEQVRTDAIREVVARCLYGVDINPMAVEMCKLSLWLVSLDPQRPFSFVDDKVLVGNSLLGLTDLRQLRELHIDPDAARQSAILGTTGGDATRSLDIDRKLSLIRRRREDLANPIGPDIMRTGSAKTRQWGEVHQLEAQLVDVADAVIAAGLRLGGKPGKKLNEAYENLRVAVTNAYPAGDALLTADPDRTLLDRILQGLEPTVETDYHRWRPLHWPIVLPDVFERGGFDAIVGNPPFLGGKKISGAAGTNVRDWMVSLLAEGTKGSADLVAYFLLRSFSLLNPGGALGLIATNTVSQGDTREVGLDRLITAGFTITRATQSASWPSASANLEYAAVWGTRTKLDPTLPRHANGTSCRLITPLLEAAGRVSGPPVRLVENASTAFQGCIVLGLGFVVTPAEASEWIAQSPPNAEVVRPYLNGEDLNSLPDHVAPRWVIDFNARTQAQAAKYELPFDRVREKVRPERTRTKTDGTFVLRSPLPIRWWHFADKRPALRAAIHDLKEVLAIARVSQTIMPVRVAARQVISDATVVFATDSFRDQAVLSSSLHQLWAITYGSTLETRVRYTGSDVFETFPRPTPTMGLERLGRDLDVERREIMLRRWLGLTKLYNLVNSPDVADSVDADVARLREIHVELDHAVMAAYGWEDVPLDHGFHTYRQMERWTVSPAARVEILDRLLEENHRRAALEAKEAT